MSAYLPDAFFSEPLLSGQAYTVHTQRLQRSETGETRGKPKYVAELRIGQYTVQVCETVQFSD